MANHKSALKRNRQDIVKNLRNRYFAKTMRNAVAALRSSTDKKAAEKELPKVVSMIDRLCKRNVIHDNKAANLKSSLATHVASL